MAVYSLYTSEEKDQLSFVCIVSKYDNCLENKFKGLFVEKKNGPVSRREFKGLIIENPLNRPKCLIL